MGLFSVLKDPGAALNSAVSNAVNNATRKIEGATRITAVKGGDDDDDGVAAINAQTAPNEKERHRQEMARMIAEEVAKEEADVQARKDELGQITSLKFSADPDEISETVNGLFSKYPHYAQIAAQILVNPDEKRDAITMKAVILEKIEFGIMKLSKLDADTAMFFQKKLDELKTPKGGGFKTKK